MTPEEQTKNHKKPRRPLSVLDARRIYGDFPMWSVTSGQWFVIRKGRLVAVTDPPARTPEPQ